MSTLQAALVRHDVSPDLALSIPQLLVRLLPSSASPPMARRPLFADDQTALFCLSHGYLAAANQLWTDVFTQSQRRHVLSLLGVQEWPQLCLSHRQALIDAARSLPPGLTVLRPPSPLHPVVADLVAEVAPFVRSFQTPRVQPAADLSSIIVADLALLDRVELAAVQHGVPVTRAMQHSIMSSPYVRFARAHLAFTRNRSLVTATELIMSMLRASIVSADRVRGISDYMLSLPFEDLTGVEDPPYALDEVNAYLNALRALSTLGLDSQSARAVSLLLNSFNVIAGPAFATPVHRIPLFLPASLAPPAVVPASDRGLHLILPFEASPSVIRDAIRLYPGVTKIRALPGAISAVVRTALEPL